MIHYKCAWAIVALIKSSSRIDINLHTTFQLHNILVSIKSWSLYQEIFSIHKCRNLSNITSLYMICSRLKTPQHYPYRLLCLFLILANPSSSISMDSIMDLLLFKTFDSIFVVVDRLFIMTHFISWNIILN